MFGGDINLAIFIVFGFMLQVLLLLNFTARILRPELELRWGRIIYYLGLVTLVLGAIYIVRGAPWNLTPAFLIYTAWAAYGYYVDIHRKLEWRTPPKLSVYILYVPLYIVTLFSFWMPLLDINWWLFIIHGALLITHTVINISSHLPSRTEE